MSQSTLALVDAQYKVDSQNGKLKQLEQRVQELNSEIGRAQDQATRYKEKCHRLTRDKENIETHHLKKHELLKT